MLDKEKIYSVVCENEDDPWCAHWDDILLMTPYFDIAKQKIIDCFAYHENAGWISGRPSGYFPRLKTYEYDIMTGLLKEAGETGTFGNVIRFKDEKAAAAKVREQFGKTPPADGSTMLEEAIFELEVDDLLLGKKTIELKCMFKHNAIPWTSFAFIDSSNARVEVCGKLEQIDLVMHDIDGETVADTQFYSKFTPNSMSDLGAEKAKYDFEDKMHPFHLWTPRRASLLQKQLRKECSDAMDKIKGRT